MLVPRLKALLRRVFRRNKVEGDLDEEIQSYIAGEIDAKIAMGLSPEEARRNAHVELGGVEQVKEQARQARFLAVIDDLIADVKYAFRSYLHSPVFSGVAIVSLALGIGANLAVFTLLDTLVFQKLPVQSPDKLMQLGQSSTGSIRTQGMISFPMYQNILERQDVFTDILVADDLLAPLTITGQDGQETEIDSVLVGKVTDNYFSLLGLHPILGRFFVPEDRGTPRSSESSGSVIVLSHRFWQQQFRGDPQVVGNSIVIGQSHCRIIGVAPKAFSGTAVGVEPMGWVPLIAFSPAPTLQSHTFTFGSYLGRLKPGINPAQAEARLTVLFQQLLAAEGRVEEASSNGITLTSAATGTDHGIRRTYTTSVLIVMGIVLLVHLIACSNVANLLLARLTARRKEISVRLAIGCSRGRLLRQLLTENLLLSVVGAITGLAVAYWSSAALVHLVGTNPQMILGQTVPMYLDLRLDWRIFAFLTAIGVLTGLVFGFLPAWGRLHKDLMPTMREAHSAGGPGAKGPLFGRLIVVFQVAISLLLATTTGLLVQTIYNLNHADKGFKTDNLVLFELGYNGPRPDNATSLRLAQVIPQHIQNLAGIDSVSLAAPIYLFFPGRFMTSLVIPDLGRERHAIRFMSVSPNYMDMLGMTIIEGRGLTESDTEHAPLVTIINEAMAKKYFPDGAIGKVLRESPGPVPPPLPTTVPPGPPIEIIGVVRDSKYNSLREQQAEPMLYYPLRQAPSPPAALEVKTQRPFSSITALVREALRDTDRNLIVRRVVTMSDQVAQSFSVEQMVTQLCVIFGTLALILACIGLFGVMSYSVAQRTGEIGIRMAVGASRHVVLRLVLKESLLIVLAGVCIGLPLALMSTRFVSALLYGITPTDATTLILSILLLFASAGIAAAIPARRASSVDPMVTLRHE